MCTNTIDSVTSSRYISRRHVHHFRNRFPCGMCAECQRQKQSEWSLRAYWQAKETFDKGGFVLFDTLTYRDSALKHFIDIYPIYANLPYGDFMAFSRDDIKKFFKLLRIRLARAGYNVGDNLKYLVTSEYGSRPDCTHRPHYHVLFFVTFSIDPIVLSRMIAECWPHGKTDGVVPSGCPEPWLYHSKNYVLSKRFFAGNSGDLVKLTNYVVKYIGKDMFLYGKLIKRVIKFFSMYNPNWTDSYQGCLAFRRFKNRVLPFHLQSQGFGEYAVKIGNRDEIVNLNALKKPINSRGVWAFVPLPLYYKRKLFYQVGYFNGDLRWSLSDFGRKYKKIQIVKSIDNFSSRLASWRPNIDAVSLSKYHFLRAGVLAPKFLSRLSDDDLIDELLDSPNLSSLSRLGELIYNCGSERYGYLNGKYLSDSYQSKYISIPRVCHCQNHAEFLVKPFCDDMVFLNNPELDSLLEEFFDWLREIGYKDDVVQIQKDYQRDRYKEFGFVTE